MILLASSACDVPSEMSGQPSESAMAVADTMVTLLAGINQAAFENAFERLDEYDYTRYARTEQFDGEDYLVAFREQVTEIRRGAADRLVQSDSGGQFEFGFFNRFVSENNVDLRAHDLVPFLLTDDPPYLSARNREKYVFRELPDTLLWDTQAKVIEVRARPVIGDGENIRRVRHFVNRATNELIAMYLERIDLALLFREESRFYVHMRAADDGRLVPYNTRFHTIIKTPFRQNHQFRTVSTYYGYRLAIPAPDTSISATGGPP